MNFWQNIEQPVIGLSPMDGVTDASFRFITAKHGDPDVILTEFVNIQSALYSPHTLLKDFTYDDIERPIVAQIYGRTPELFYKVAHIVGELGFDGLDINMGCPAKKVAASGCGAALIRTPDVAREIIRAAKRGVRDWSNGQRLEDVGFDRAMIEQVRWSNLRRSGSAELRQRRLLPVSVKTRLGYDRVIVDQWLRTLLDEEPAAISLHGRTLEQGYKGDADWESIARAAAMACGTNTLLLGNGDVRDLHDVYRRVRETGVSGVLIGRAAQGEPWIFRGKDELKRAFASGGRFLSRQVPIPLRERFDVVVEHSERFQALCGEARFVAMRKHLTWYCRDFRGAAEMRGRMTKATSAKEVARELNEFLRVGSSGPPASRDQCASPELRLPA